MKVSTRIIAGYGILILLTVSIIWFQVMQIQKLNSINHKLSELNTGNAVISFSIRYHENVTEESALKYYGTSDSHYLDQFRDFGSLLEEDLIQMRRRAIEPAELEAIEQVSKSWKAVQKTIDTGRKPAFSDEKTKQLNDQLSAMGANTKLVVDATQTAIRNAAKRSAETAADATRFSWIAAVAALLLSILASVPIVWSIASRLRELERATRVVAAGQFEHRLPDSGADEFSDLARDFNTMARKLGELDQMKKDFVSHVSHDLKGPLASTRETVHLLLEEIPGPLNDRQRRLLNLCLKSFERLSAMIGNLLDVSRMEAGMMDYKFEPCNLVPLAYSAASEFEGLAREKKIDLAVQCAVSEIWVECDHGRITQVISNLIENAIKFSQVSGRADLKIEANGQFALLSVWDRGPGVPWASRTKIFDRFHQVNPGKKVAGQGVGLGLAICRTIVEAHGGTIWVEENPGGGSVFYMKVKSFERSKT